MKIQTTKLIGRALDWAVNQSVAKAYPGEEVMPLAADHTGELRDGGFKLYSPSTLWEQGGPLMQRAKIGYTFWNEPNCRASFAFPVKHPNDKTRDPTYHGKDGPTPLIAGMRCFVAWQFGDEIDVPDEIAGPVA